MKGIYDNEYMVISAPSYQMDMFCVPTGKKGHIEKQMKACGFELDDGLTQVAADVTAKVTAAVTTAARSAFDGMVSIGSFGRVDLGKDRAEIPDSTRKELEATVPILAKRGMSVIPICNSLTGADCTRMRIFLAHDFSGEKFKKKDGSEVASVEGDNPITVKLDNGEEATFTQEQYEACRKLKAQIQLEMYVSTVSGPAKEQMMKKAANTQQCQASEVDDSKIILEDIENSSGERPDLPKLISVERMMFAELSKNYEALEAGLMRAAGRLIFEKGVDVESNREKLAALELKISQMVGAREVEGDFGAALNQKIMEAVKEIYGEAIGLDSEAVKRIVTEEIGSQIQALEQKLESKADKADLDKKADKAFVEQQIADLEERLKRAQPGQTVYSDLNQEIESLKLKVTNNGKLGQRLNALETTVRELGTKVDAQASDFHDKLSKKASTEKVEQLSGKVTELIGELAAFNLKEGRLEGLEQEFRRFKDELDKQPSADQLKELQDSFDKLNRQFEDFQERLGVVENRLGDHDGRIAALEGAGYLKKDELREEIDALFKGDADTFEARLQSLDDRLKDAEALKGRVETLEQKVKELESDCKDLKSDRVTQAQLDELRKELEQARDSIPQQVKEHVEAQTRGLTNQVDRLQSTVTDLNAKVEEHTSNITQLQEEVSELKEKDNALEARLKVAEDKVEALETGNTQLHKDLDAARAERDKLSGEVKDLKIRVQDLEDRLGKGLDDLVATKVQEALQAAGFNSSEVRHSETQTMAEQAPGNLRDGPLEQELPPEQKPPEPPKQQDGKQEVPNQPDPKDPSPAETTPGTTPPSATGKGTEPDKPEPPSVGGKDEKEAKVTSTLSRLTGVAALNIKPKVPPWKGSIKRIFGNYQEKDARYKEIIAGAYDSDIQKHAKEKLIVLKNRMNPDGIPPQLEDIEKKLADLEAQLQGIEKFHDDPESFLNIIFDKQEQIGQGAKDIKLSDFEKECFAKWQNGGDEIEADINADINADIKADIKAHFESKKIDFEQAHGEQITKLKENKELLLEAQSAKPTPGETEQSRGEELERLKALAKDDEKGRKLREQLAMEELLGVQHSRWSFSKFSGYEGRYKDGSEKTATDKFKSGAAAAVKGTVKGVLVVGATVLTVGAYAALTKFGTKIDVIPKDTGCEVKSNIRLNKNPSKWRHSENVEFVDFVVALMQGNDSYDFDVKGFPTKLRHDELVAKFDAVLAADPKKASDPQYIQARERLEKTTFHHDERKKKGAEPIQSAKRKEMDTKKEAVGKPSKDGLFERVKINRGPGTAAIENKSNPTKAHADSGEVSMSATAAPPTAPPTTPPTTPKSPRR